MLQKSDCLYFMCVDWHAEGILCVRASNKGATRQHQNAVSNFQSSLSYLSNHEQHFSMLSTFFFTLMIIEKPIKTGELCMMIIELSTSFSHLKYTLVLQLINDHVTETKSRAPVAEKKLFELMNNCTIETTKLGLLGEASK